MTESTTSILLVNRERRIKAKSGFRSPTVILSLVWLLGLLVASLAAPLWLRYGPFEQDLSVVLQGPTPTHLLGTDSSVVTSSRDWSPPLHPPFSSRS